MTEVKGSMICDYHGSYNLYYTVRADYISGSICGIAFFEFWLEASVVVRCCYVLTGKGWVLVCLGHQSTPETSLQLKQSLSHDKGPFTHVDLKPRCRWAASLLPSHSLKLAIMKQWFELTVECQASQFSWHWWQQLVENKLVLALFLGQPPAKWNYGWHPLGKCQLAAGEQ